MGKGQMGGGGGGGGGGFFLFFLLLVFLSSFLLLLMQCILHLYNSNRDSIDDLARYLQWMFLLFCKQASDSSAPVAPAQ